MAGVTIVTDMVAVQEAISKSIFKVGEYKVPHYMHYKTRPIYYGRNSRDEFVVHLIILTIVTPINWGES